MTYVLAAHKALGEQRSRVARGVSRGACVIAHVSRATSEMVLLDRPERCFSALSIELAQDVLALLAAEHAVAPVSGRVVEDFELYPGCFGHREEFRP